MEQQGVPEVVVADAIRVLRGPVAREPVVKDLLVQQAWLLV